MNMARYVDHAVLKPDMNRDDAIGQIRLGLAYNVRTVCVRPCDIPIASELCKGTETQVSCVLAFPHGDALSASKADEARRYVALGVAEIDMVVNYGYIRSGLWAELEADIRAVTAVARPAGVKIKAILETACLTLGEVAQATEVAVTAQADFVKTSTGFGGGGATEDAVAVMVKTAAGRIAVKASGGIRERNVAERFIAMGAARLGVGAATTPVICGIQDRSLGSGEGY